MQKLLLYFNPRYLYLIWECEQIILLSLFEYVIFFYLKQNLYFECTLFIG